MRLSRASYNSSRPSRDQIGNAPPPVEIVDLPEPNGPPAGKGRTYTSERPDSVDVYAIQRPSGENAGSSSAKGVPRNSSGLPGLGCSGSLVSSGSVQISIEVPAFCSLNARRLPSGENE